MTAIFEDVSSPGRRSLLDIGAAAKVPAGTEVVGIFTAPGARSVKVPGGGTVSAEYLSLRGFEGRSGQTAVLPVADTNGNAAAGAGAGPVFLAVGTAAPEGAGAAEGVRRAAAALVRAAGRARSVAIIPNGPAGTAQPLAEGAALATYRYLGFKSSTDGGSRLERVTVVTPQPAAWQTGLKRGEAIASAVAMVRDLVNEPPGSLTPTRLADISSLVGSERGLEVTVYDAAAIEKERLGGLAGVARGSSQEPRMVRLEYTPTGARGRTRAATVALVGKGITFDSGGLSLKSGEGMMNMKDDMAGSAVVLGTMSLLAELKLPVRVIGYMPLTENMPGGRAIKPGDVLRARNGKTIEVLNTDAEGRLVLADGLSLAAEDKPDAIIDLATLTGAVVVALGRRIAGLMGNDETLIRRVRSAGDRAGERLWPLPLPADYRRDIDSQVADMKNIGLPSQAGSIIAGLFLQEFVDGIPWAHLDIAGTAFGDTDSAYFSRGATGFGVRTLVELLTDWPAPTGRAPARVPVKKAAGPAKKAVGTTKKAAAAAKSTRRR